MPQTTATSTSAVAEATARVPAGPPARLNTFQRLMRRWEQLGPYNAGQVMQVTGRADLDRWRTAAEAAMAETGLGVPEFLGDKAVRYRPVDHLPIAIINTSLQEHVDEELNRGFGPDEPPVRFFVVPLADGSHYFGAIYNHWIADSRAMRELMQRIFVRYQSPGEPSPLPALTLEQPGNFRQLFGKYVMHLPRTAALWESLRNVRKHLKSLRINLRNPLDFDSRTLNRRLPAGVIDRVHRYAKARGASVNDVFLAVLGQSLGRHTAPEVSRKKRKLFRTRRDRVGLGTIVDIRDASAKPLDNVFGLYLSSYTVSLARPEQTDLGMLLADVAGRTRTIKRRNLAIRGYCALMWVRFCWDRVRNDRTRSRIFYKNVPLAAGISNVNMTSSWVDTRTPPEDGKPVVLDYLRISPTGPMTPLVFTLTTIHQRLSLFVTYRTTAFEGRDVEKIVDDFIARLGEIQP